MSFWRLSLVSILVTCVVGDMGLLVDSTARGEELPGYRILADGRVEMNRRPAEPHDPPPHQYELLQPPLTGSIVNDGPPAPDQGPTVTQPVIRRLPSPTTNSAASPPAPCNTVLPPCYNVTDPFGHRDAFRARMERHVTAASPMDPTPAPSSLPPDFVPWWESAVVSPQHRASQPLSITLDQMLVEALAHSPHIQAVRDTALSRETAIVEAQADFDARAFMDSKFVRTSDPVGNLLTTGGPDRYRDQDWRYNAGLRKLTKYGGTVEVAQQFGFQDNNSEFLVPKQQGTSRLSLSFNQPLLNGAGRVYNESQIVLAELDTRAANCDVAKQLTEHLMQVTEAYWDLYLRRAALQQKQRNVDRGVEILRHLEDRRQIDALQSQVLTARAATAMRQTELNRAAAAIRNAEARLRGLVNSPELFQDVPIELIPDSTPSSNEIEIPLGDAVVTALYNRPEIDKALQQTQMAAVRLEMSTNELLPVLNLVLETYVAGLRGEARIDNAWMDQFNTGEPGYTAGLMFEIPINNRAANARFRRRQIDFRRVTNDLRAAVDMLTVEVEIAARDVETTYRDIQSWYRSMVATNAEVNYLHDRWELLPGDDRAASFLLEDLLKAQDRLAASEFGFVKAQYSHTLSLVRLKQVMGTLLECDAPIGAP